MTVDKNYVITATRPASAKKRQARVCLYGARSVLKFAAPIFPAEHSISARLTKDEGDEARRIAANIAQAARAEHPPLSGLREFPSWVY